MSPAVDLSELTTEQKVQLGRDLRAAEAAEAEAARIREHERVRADRHRRALADVAQRIANLRAWLTPLEEVAAKLTAAAEALAVVPTGETYEAQQRRLTQLNYAQQQVAEVLTGGGPGGGLVGVLLHHGHTVPDDAGPRCSLRGARRLLAEAEAERAKLELETA